VSGTRSTSASSPAARAASAARGAGAFVWDFVVGDDWVGAVGIVLALGLTALVATSTVPAWWITPLGVVGVLALSLWRARR
jgi:hypothetical protein